MKKFRKILVDPQTNLKSLNLNINEVKKFDLTTSGLTPEEQANRADEAMKFIKKNKDVIIAVGTGTEMGEAFVTSLLNVYSGQSNPIVSAQTDPPRLWVATTQS